MCLRKVSRLKFRLIENETQPDVRNVNLNVKNRLKFMGQSLGETIVFILINEREREKKT